MGIPVTVIDELADVRHTLAFIRASVPEISGYGKLQTDALSGFVLIMNMLEARLRKIEHVLQDCILESKK
jgi:hypothetical protein